MYSLKPMHSKLGNTFMVIILNVNMLSVFVLTGFLKIHFKSDDDRFDVKSYLYVSALLYRRSFTAAGGWTRNKTLRKPFYNMFCPLNNVQNLMIGRGGGDLLHVRLFYNALKIDNEHGSERVT